MALKAPSSLQSLTLIGSGLLGSIQVYGCLQGGLYLSLWAGS